MYTYHKNQSIKCFLGRISLIDAVISMSRAAALKRWKCNSQRR